jgi:nucleotide-binding universal stress UspA family protein
MKILLAAHGSACSLRAVRYVVRHIGMFGRKPGVVLLKLDPPMVEQISAVVDPGEVARYHEKNGKTALREAKRVLTKVRIPHRSRLVVGEPGGIIARTAKNSRCNLIARGSHGHSALKGLMLGSVVTKVLGHPGAHCSLSAMEYGGCSPLGKANVRCRSLMHRRCREDIVEL